MKRFTMQTLRSIHSTIGRKPSLASSLLTGITRHQNIAHTISSLQEDEPFHKGSPIGFEPILSASQAGVLTVGRGIAYESFSVLTTARSLIPRGKVGNAGFEPALSRFQSESHRPG